MSDNGLPEEWHGGTYPPGTPEPTTYGVRVHCLECDDTFQALMHDETRTVGTSVLEPDECPNCKSVQLQIVERISYYDEW